MELNMKTVIADHYGPQTAASYDQICDSLFWAYTSTLENIVAYVMYANPTQAQRDRWHICDLGAGTGNLSARLIQSLYQRARHEGRPLSAQLLLNDSSPHMLEQAQNKFKSHPDVALRLSVNSLLSVFDDVDDESLDVVMSSFAIHHLDENQKNELIRQAFRKLKSGGLLVIGDRMPTSHESFGVPEDLSLRIVASRFHPLMKAHHPNGSLDDTCDFINREFERDGDQPSPRESHLQWMKAAGFESVTTPFLSFGCVVVGGRKP